MTFVADVTYWKLKQVIEYDNLYVCVLCYFQLLGYTNEWSNICVHFFITKKVEFIHVNEFYS